MISSLIQIHAKPPGKWICFHCHELEERNRRISRKNSTSGGGDANRNGDSLSGNNATFLPKGGHVDSNASR